MVINEVGTGDFRRNSMGEHKRMKQVRRKGGRKECKKEGSKEGMKEGWERKMELFMKHDSNGNICHGSLFTRLTNTIYQICYFLPS
jgi:hypothetical protein